MAISEPLDPDVTINSNLNIIPFNQTYYSVTLSLSYNINTNGSDETAYSTSLDFSTNNLTWNNLTNDVYNNTSYNHILDLDFFNTNNFYYRYTVEDDKGGLSYSNITVNQLQYQALTTKLDIISLDNSNNQTNLLRAYGNYNSILGISISSINTMVNLEELVIKYKNNYDISWNELQTIGLSNNYYSGTASYNINSLTSSFIDFSLSIKDFYRTFTYSSIRMSFQNFIYFGYCTYSNPDLIPNNILNSISLVNTKLSNNKSSSYIGVNPNSLQYVYYIYPYNLGLLTTINQNGSSDVTTAFDYSVKDIQNQYGYTMSYYIYYSTDTSAYSNSIINFN